MLSYTRRIVLIFLAVLNTLLWLYPNTTLAAPGWATAKYINESEIQIDYPSYGVQYRMNKVSGAANFTSMIVVKKGLFGAAQDCGALLSGLPIANNISVTASGQRQTTATGGSTPACESNVLSGLVVQAQLNTQNSNTAAPDTASTKVLAVVVSIENNQGLTDGGQNFIDLEKAPQKDVIVVNDLSLAGPANQIKRVEATRELGQGANVVYKANFTDIKPGNYEICSKDVAKKCVTVTKIGGKLENVFIEADKSAYDIVAESAADKQETAKSCEEQFGISSGWLVCSALELISNGIDALFGFADSLLNIDAQKLYDNPGLRTAWSYFRAIATFMLVAVGLVIIIGQAVGGSS